MFVFGKFRVAFLVIFIMNAIVHAYLAFVVWCYWKELTKHEKLDVKREQKIHANYALRRFGNY